MPSFLSGLVPLRWHAGPLDVAQPDADVWSKPEALGVLGDSPFNAIVVNWTDDPNQRKALQPIIDKAKASGIAVVGWSKTGGLTAVAPEADSAGVVCASNAKWARIPVSEGRRSGGVETGPTGAPWVDSNGWLVQMLQVKNPGKRVWLMPEVPAGIANFRTEQYVLGVADAAAYGARWIPSFQLEMRAGLLKGDSSAIEAWKEVQKAIKFFDTQAAPHYSNMARLGIVSDFTGANESLAGEVLNLCARRHLQTRAIDIGQVSGDVLRDLTTVLLVHTRPPSEVHRPLGEFISRGGLVIAPASVAHMAGQSPSGNFDQRFDIFTHGEGRYAIARKPWTDPYALAVDVHLLMSRKQDLVRLWNGGATNARLTGSPSGPAFLQILNYTARAMGYPMSAWVSMPFKSATLRSMTGAAVEPLAVMPKGDGTEVSLPPFPVYASIEFRG